MWAGLGHALRTGMDEPGEEPVPFRAGGYPVMAPEGRNAEGGQHAEHDKHGDDFNQGKPIAGGWLHGICHCWGMSFSSASRFCSSKVRKRICA